jgi:uncharacterized protein
VLILLPPSEGKSDAVTGPPLEFSALSIPALNRARLRMAQALVKLCDGRPARARKVLGLGTTQDAEIERDRQLFTAPTAPAAQIYSGVLFEALGYKTLSATAQRRLDKWALVSSALWGTVRLPDHIPPYRLSADVTLPRIGPAGAYWRKHLAPAMAAEAESTEPILDLRSGAYVKMWTAPEGLAERTAVGRILQRMPDGSARVVSHHNKATKGLLVRALARQRSAPGSVPELVELIRSLGFAIEAIHSQPGKPTRLDIFVDDI